jgi:thymidylate synthase (FAD)
VNEYSARYSILDNEFYIPKPEHLAAQSKANRQGRDQLLAGKEAERVFALLRKDAELVYEHYMEMLNEGETGQPLDPERSGLARELARMNLSLAFYTQWYWKTNLHNLMHFLSLRADAHAQYEIRVYAETMLDTLKRWCPFCHDAFMEYRMGGAHLSKTGLAAVKRMIAGERVDQKSSGLNPREWRELMSALGLSSK